MYEDKLWIPQDTTSMHQREIKEENYPDSVRVSQVILNSPDDRGRECRSVFANACNVSITLIINGRTE